MEHHLINDSCVTSTSLLIGDSTPQKGTREGVKSKHPLTVNYVILVSGICRSLTDHQNYLIVSSVLLESDTAL